MTHWKRDAAALGIGTWRLSARRYFNPTPEELDREERETASQRLGVSLRQATNPSVDPLEGANCSLCGATADNFHVPDDLWEHVGLGHAQACFRCFRIEAWHVGVRPDSPWEVRLARPILTLERRDT